MGSDQNPMIILNNNVCGDKLFQSSWKKITDQVWIWGIFLNNFRRIENIDTLNVVKEVSYKS